MDEEQRPPLTLKAYIVDQDVTMFGGGDGDGGSGGSGGGDDGNGGGGGGPGERDVKVTLFS